MYDIHVNKLSIISILLISFSIFAFFVLIYIGYCKYKQNRNEIRKNILKIQLRQFDDHNDNVSSYLS